MVVRKNYVNITSLFLPLANETKTLLKRIIYLESSVISSSTTWKYFLNSNLGLGFRTFSTWNTYTYGGINKTYS